MLCFLSELQQYKVLRSKRNHICSSVLYYVYLGFGFQIIVIQIPFHYEVHSINRLRGDVRLGEGRDRGEGPWSQVHPQPWLRWWFQDGGAVFRQGHLQAAIAGLKGAHQRADPRVERIGQHAEGQVCSRHFEQDLWGESLFEAELLDCQGWRRGTCNPAGTCGS